MKGIILAGGSGTRLHPLTLSVSKQLMPIYDKPMIYYPLSTLMYAGINEVLVISTPKDLPLFKTLLGDGKKYGCSFEYAVQEHPNGLAEAFLIGEEFIGDDDVCLILGDNIFYGHGLIDLLSKSISNVENNKKATIFGYYVKDPESYGVAELDNLGNVVSLEEKPKAPKSNYAVVGIYFYPNSVLDIAKNIKPSDRGEYEITTINQVYLEQKSLVVELMRRGYAWLDAGTHETLLEASNFIQIIERRQGLKVACIEEIAYRMGYISKSQLLDLAQSLKKNQYGQYLITCVNESN